jgi:hypothetical protein
MTIDYDVFSLECFDNCRKSSARCTFQLSQSEETWGHTSWACVYLGTWRVLSFEWLIGREMATMGARSSGPWTGQHTKHAADLTWYAFPPRIMGFNLQIHILFSFTQQRMIRSWLGCWPLLSPRACLLPACLLFTKANVLWKGGV